MQSPCLSFSSNTPQPSNMTASVFDSTETIGSFGEIMRNSAFDSLASIDSAVLPLRSTSGPSSPKTDEKPAKRSTSETEKFVSSMVAIFNGGKQPEVTRSSSSGSAKRGWEEATASQSWNNLGDVTAMEDVNFGDVFRTQQDTVEAEQPKGSKEEAVVPRVSHEIPGESDEAAVGPQPTDTIEPNDSDVLLGRGGRSGNHPGNKRYLKLKDEMQKVYLTAEKNQKTILSQQLVDTVNKVWMGRFLKCGKDGKWFEISNEKARHKCSQALREVNTPEVRAKKRARYGK